MYPIPMNINAYISIWCEFMQHFISRLVVSYSDTLLMRVTAA